MSVWVHQHCPIVDHRVTILTNAIFLRNVIVSHARFWKLSAYPNVALVSVGRSVLFDHVTMEAGSLISAQDACDTTDDPSDRTSDDSAHRTGSAVAFAGTSFNASRHTLG